MFTGIIEGLGTIKEIRSAAAGRAITVMTDFALDGTRIGDSIAVNGACLTVTRLAERHFTADISPETLQKTTFMTAKIGDRVNLERALRLSDRLDGHLVSGHVDDTGTVTEVRPQGNTLFLRIGMNPSIGKYVIPKGSIAIDGISLTVNTCFDGGFEICIIPHTARETTISNRKTGDRVNLETDMIGKYVAQFMAPQSGTHQPSAGTRLDLSYLSKHGFA